MPALKRSIIGRLPHSFSFLAELDKRYASLFRGEIAVEFVEAHKTEDPVLVSHEDRQRQIQKVLQSASFRNASMLQHLLQYLAAKADGHGPETLKEYTIGVEAFGRPQDFDPKTDTIVRVQIHRLRQKLKEYYDSDGVHDPIWIDIPKGHYLPTFEIVGPPEERFDGEPAATLEASGQVPGEKEIVFRQKEDRAARATILYASAAVALVIAVFVAGWWLGNARAKAKASNQALVVSSQSALDRSADPVRTYWSSFLGNDPSPIITYPDAVFLLDNFNDLFRFRRGATDYRGVPVDPHVALQFASNPALVAKAGPLYYENSYLGFGELKAVGMLSYLFGQMGMKPVIKPSRELTVDDLEQHNVIMLGSSAQNIAVAHFSTMGDFSFRNPNSLLEEWRGMIVNAHPRQGELAAYHTERDASTQALKSDYCLITVQPGVVPGRYIIVLAGLDTTGTEGATLFATSRQGIEELNRVLGTLGKPGARNAFPTYQALLQIRLERGYDVLGASLVTVHPLATSSSEAGSSPGAQAPLP